MDDAGLLADLAQRVGRHALPLFFVVLALLQAATVACWWWLRRHAMAGRSAPRDVRWRIAFGCGVILLGASAFLTMAALVQAARPVAADMALTEALRGATPHMALQGFGAFTHLGDTATLTLLCIGIAIALVATGNRGLALGCVVAIAGNGLLNRTLKAIFGRARPEQIEGVVLEQGFSFPSGHSSGAVVTYGMLAYVAVRLLPERWHLPAVATAVAIAFTVGASRIFLQVHFASDVVAGFASGSAWLAICIMTMERARWRAGRARMGSAS